MSKDVFIVFNMNTRFNEIFNYIVFFVFEWFLNEERKIVIAFFFVFQLQNHMDSSGDLE